MYFWGPLEFPSDQVLLAGRIAFLLHVGFNFVPIYQLRGVTGSCQWRLTD